MRKFFFIIVLFFSVLSPLQSAYAQAENPVYVVQSGDTLGGIAQRFGISLNDLLATNGISNPNLISPGARLVIPGFSGVGGVLVTKPFPLGESLKSIAIKNQVDISFLAKLNRITSPNEIFTGVNLILPEVAQNSSLLPQATLAPGQSPLETAIKSNASPWTIALSNKISSTIEMLPGDLVYMKKSDGAKEISSISPKVKKIEIHPLPLVQGKTYTIRVYTNEALDISGTLSGSPLNFKEEKANQYIALQGIHAMANPGLASFSIQIKAKDQSIVTFEENLLLKTDYFIKDPQLSVDPTTLDPAVTKPEEDQVRQIISQASKTRYWDDVFLMPVDEPICIQSTYGNRRSYNGSPFNYFHTGLDFGVCKTLNIYAPAAGIVVFAGPLTVRGNATIIDHGWGVFSGYWHQAEIKVKTGDQVKPGQLIGLVGKTGRVTGPHLHWEIIVNGIQVEPLEWLEVEFPQ